MLDVQGGPSLLTSASALLLEFAFIPAARSFPEYPGILITLAMLPAIIALAFCGVLLGAQEFKASRSRSAKVGFRTGEAALGFDIHHAAVLLTLPLWMVSPLAVLLLVALQPRFGRRKIILPVLVFGLLYLVAWLVLRMDPGAFMVWFMD